MGRVNAGGMNVGSWGVFFGAWLVAAGVVTLAGCEPAAPKPAMPGKVLKGKPADNSHCLVCHLDFKAEVISATHEKAGISCESCHGDSLAHGDDEFNIITPDVKYGRAEIDAFCQGCHKTHEKGEAHRAFLKKWELKRRPNGRTVSEESVCTDCHGKHAILSPDKQVDSPQAP